MNSVPSLGITVPDNWTVASAAELAAMHGGSLQTGPFGSQLHAEDYSCAGVPVVMPRDLLEGYLLPDNAARVGSEHVKRLAKHCLAEGDVVFSRRGDVKRVGVVGVENVGWLCGTGCLRLRLGDAPVDPAYLRRYFAHPVVGEWLVRNAKGATMPNLNTKVIGDVPIVLPPLAEQRRIADILDRADEIRRKREESLKLVDDLLQSVFLDVFGDPVTNPKGWPVKRLRDLVSPVRPITYGIVKPGPDVQGGTPYVRVVDLKNGTVDFSGLRRTSAEIAHSYRRSRLEEGDILVSIRGHVGRCAMVPSGAAGFNITQDTARVAPTDGTTSEYLMCALASVGSQRWMSRHTKGASVQGINLGDLRNLPIAQPPLDLQRRFSRAFATIISCSENARRALQQQDHATASLTQRAFRGEL